MKDPRISRTRQAKLYWENDKIRLVDTGSKNGTYYNRRCMVPGEPVVLNSGDCFSIVDTDFSYSEIVLVQDTANTPGVE